MDVYVIVTIVLSCLLPVAAFLGFYFTKKLIEKQLKNNPPINEEQIRAMFSAMGRTASEQQIRSVMNSMKNAKRKSPYSKRK